MIYTVSWIKLNNFVSEKKLTEIMISHSLSAFWKCIVVFCILLTSYCLLLTPVRAGDAPFTSPANWGGTGLMEIPTARIMKAGSYRIGVGQVEPYRYYYGAISPFKRLEVDLRITEFLHIPFREQKTSKDKAVDLKFQFYSEGKYMPALAIGLMDPHGTRIFASQYIVASKQIYPFDFTIGFGNGRFGKRPLVTNTENVKVEMFTDTSQWLRDSQLFWGVQFAPSEKFALMFEYSPIRFHEQTGDRAQAIHFRKPVRSKYNFGIRYKPTKWSEIALSYQRGEEIGVSISTAFDIGNPMIPIYDRIHRGSDTDSRHPLEKRITSALFKSGFSDIGVAVMGNDLFIEVQNEKYLYNTKAIGVVLKAIADVLPENLDKIRLVLKENSVPVLEFKTTRLDIIDLFAEKMKLHEFFALSEFNTEVTDMPDIPVRHRKLYRYGIRPSLETFLNDPAGFFKYRFGVSGWFSYYPWKGASFVAGVEAYPLNNVTTTNEPLSIPVRSDIVDYKDEKLVLGTLLFEQITRLTPVLYGRLAGGLLEVQYAGIDGEIAFPLFDGRLLLGISGSAVKKRESENPLKLKADAVKDIFTTAFVNARLNIPELESSIDVKAGRFLAGDNGVRFTVSKYFNGVTIWAWYSFSDTSIFSDDFNRGYHDKGLGITIPLRLFKGTDSRTVYSYSLSPWTRDTAQDIDHYNTLFNFINRNAEIYLDKDRQMIYR